MTGVQTCALPICFPVTIFPEGKVVGKGGWVKSIPIPVNGNSSPFAIRGKYDLLMEFSDGTYGVIDCKFQGKDNDKSEFYSPQLEAYAFSLENPASDAPKKVSVLGLLVWSPKKPVGNPSDGFNLELNSSWFPIKRNPDALNNRLTCTNVSESKKSSGVEGFTSTSVRVIFNQVLLSSLLFVC